ncbi:MAG: haloacid dehalogenase-like hydrolase [Oscillatoriales cyanobacterium]|nr:MAG: haloacid dehalogenase-like hydrolase [Oscillatoriales cyanobacterium]
MFGSENTHSHHNYVESVGQVHAILDQIDEKTPIIIDFDETLFLRNSTEEYLNSLRPRSLALVLLLVLDKLKPWRWLPGLRGHRDARDWLRVVLSTVLFPWTWFRWPAIARRLAQTQSNQALIDHLQQQPRDRIIVASNGFTAIVQPILTAMPIQIDQFLACRLWRGGLIDRDRNKLDRLQQHLSAETIARSVVITDSIDDQPLLNQSAYPCLVVWPHATYVAALSQVYLPFVYLEKAKHPGQRFLLRAILYEDWITLVLGISLVSSQPVLHALATLCFMLSLWCIYEVGYIENDRIAEQYEEHPQLSETYHQYIENYDHRSPWLWASLFALPGLALVTAINTDLFSHFQELYAGRFAFDLGNYLQQGLITAIQWAALLVLLRLTYRVYNLIDVDTRTWMYPILHVYRRFGFLVIGAASLVGMLFFTSYIFARWLPYLIYRRGGDRRHFPEQLVWLVLFTMLLTVVGSGTHHFDEVFNHQALLAIAWLLFKSRHQIGEHTKRIHFLGPLF